MTDEDASQPEAAPIEPISQPQEAAPVAVEPEIAPTEPQTAQIPASEPIAPEPTPEPVLIPAPATSAPAVVPTITHAARDLLVKARATIQFQKTAKLEKILTALQKKNHITNDEVEKLLHVSDATATRYLEALVKQGKIKKIGTTGKAVTYTKP